MDRVQFKATLYREGEIPLVDGTNVDLEPAAPPAPLSNVRPLLWAGVLACIVAGAWLCGALWRWQAPATPICAGAWLLLCLLAIGRAWKFRHGR